MARVTYKFQDMNFMYTFIACLRWMPKKEKEEAKCIDTLYLYGAQNDMGTACYLYAKLIQYNMV